MSVWHDYLLAGEVGKLRKFLNKYGGKRTGGLDVNSAMGDRSPLTPLQFACRQNDINLMEMLLSHQLPGNQRIDVLKRDLESGMTALAVALYYGHLQLAMRLVDWVRASRSSAAEEVNQLLTLLDNCGHTPSGSLSFMLRMQRHTNAHSGGSVDLLTWGSSANYSLCHGDGDDRRLPDLVQFPGAAVQDIRFSKYHVACLTAAGDLFMAGHGGFGRLGVGTDRTQLLPCKVPNLPRVCAVSLGSYHSLIVTAEGNVWSCGRNDYGQLGLQTWDVGSESFRWDPTPVKHLKNKGIAGVAASRIHSVAFGKDCLYTWGLNRGQLGYRSLGDAADPIERSPKQVIALPSFVRISAACCNEHVTLILTEHGDVYALVNFAVVKLYLPQDKYQSHRNDNASARIVKIDANQDSITLLSGAGLLFNVYFEGSKYTFQRILRKRVFDSHFIDFALAIDSSILVLTANGKVFHGTLARSRRSSSRRLSRVSLNKDEVAENDKPFSDTVTMDFTPVAGLKWVRRVYASPSGSYACIRENYPVDCQANKKQLSLNDELCKLYEKDSLNPGDAFSRPDTGDMVLTCATRNFYVHQLLLSSYSEPIYGLLKGLPEVGELSLSITSDKRPCISLGAVTEGTVVDFLSMIYFQEYPNIMSESLRRLLQILKIDQLPLPPLGITIAKVSKSNTVDIGMDVWISLSDGYLYGNRLILSARSEFFRAAVGMESLWNPRHSGTIKVSLQHFKKDTIYIYLEFCHSDDFEWKPSKALTIFEQINGIKELMAIADELLTAGLKAYCEDLLHSLLDLKTVCLIFSVADFYSAVRLKGTCLLFIAANFDLLFDSSAFVGLDIRLLNDVEVFIKQRIETMFPYKFGQQKSLKATIDLENKTIRDRLLKHVKEADEVISVKMDSLNLHVDDSSEEPSAHSELEQGGADEVICSSVPPKSIPIKSKVKKNTSLKLNLSEYCPSSTPKTPARTFIWTSPPNSSPCTSRSFQDILNAEMKQTPNGTRDIVGNNELSKTPASIKKLSQKERRAISLSSIEKSPALSGSSKSWASIPAPVSLPNLCFPDLNHAGKSSASISNPTRAMTFSEIQKQQKKEVTEINRRKKKSLKQIQMEEAAVVEIEQWYRRHIEPGSGERFTVKIVP